jgi:hypothetical protein
MKTQWKLLRKYFSFSMVVGIFSFSSGNGFACWDLAQVGSSPGSSLSLNVVVIRPPADVLLPRPLVESFVIV